MRKDNLENKDLKDYFDQIKEDLSGYLNKRLELFKLSAYSKISIAVSTVTYTLLVSLLIFNVFLITLFALGFFFGELLGSYAAGFGILILLSLIVLLLVAANTKRINRFFGNRIIALIRKIVEEDEN